MKQILLYVAIAAALYGAGYGCGKRSVRAPEIKTDTLYVDKPFVVRDTIYQRIPGQVVVYQPMPSDQLTTDCILRPVDLPRFNLVPRRPLRFQSRKAYLSVYDPTTQQWQQQVFRLPERTWGYNLSAVVTLREPWETFSRTRLSGGLRATLRFKRVSISAEARSTLTGSFTASGELSTRLWGTP